MSPTCNFDERANSRRESCLRARSKNTRMLVDFSHKNKIFSRTRPVESADVLDLLVFPDSYEFRCSGAIVPVLCVSLHFIGIR